MHRFLAIELLLSCAACAQDLPRGRLIEKIEARGDAAQSYAAWLPSNYSNDRAWPVLYCLDPLARGRMPVERFSAAAEKFGVIVVGSNNSRNGPMAPVARAIDAMYADTHERFRIDDAQTYVAGFSGGARVALRLAAGVKARGVIPCGAGFGGDVPREYGVPVAGVIGVDDFNYDEMRDLQNQFAARKAFAKLIIFSGPHEWPPAESLVEAFAFLRAPTPGVPAPNNKDEQKAAELFDRYHQRLTRATAINDYAVEVEALQRDAAQKDDSPRRRAARRALSAAVVGNVEQGSALLAEKQNAAAAQALERAALAEPSRGNLWYACARAQAAAGYRKQARESLDKAERAGFPARERAAADPILKEIL